MMTPPIWATDLNSQPYNDHIGSEIRDPRKRGGKMQAERTTIAIHLHNE